jgi:hypothetical protein
MISERCPASRRAIRNMPSELQEGSIHQQTKTAHHADTVQQGVVIAAKPLFPAKPVP